MRWRLIPIAILLAAAACASLDGLSGGPPLEEAGDGGGSIPGVLVEGGAEGATADRDASAPDDASVDADAGSYCARQTGFLFCDDFDEVPDAATGWASEANSFPTSSITLGAPSISQPNAIRFVGSTAGSDGGLQSGTKGNLYLHRDLTVMNASFRGISFELDYFNSSAGNKTAPLTVFAFGFARTGTNDSFQLTGQNEAFQLIETRPQQDGGGTPGTLVQGTSSIPLDQWTHITLTIVFNKSQTASSITFETTATEAQTNKIALEQYLDTTLAPYLNVGLLDSTGPRSVIVDNVIVRLL